MRSKTLLAAAVLLLLWPAISLGANFITADKEGRAVTDRELDSDLFIFGNNVTVDHTVKQDVISAGNTVDINADVNQDLHAVGNVVRVNGRVGDDLFAAGNTVLVQTNSVDDLFAAGNLVDISSDNVIGNIYAAGNKINLRGHVKGSVYLDAITVNIKSGAIIDGDLVTVNGKPNIADNARIMGTLRHARTKTSHPATSGKIILAWLSSVITWFTISLILTYLLPHITTRTIDTALSQSGRSLLFGFAWAIFLLPVLVLLLATLVIWPLTLIIGPLSISLLVIAHVYAMALLGTWVTRKLGKDETKIIHWQHLLLGVVLLRTIGLIPLIGALIYIVIVLITFGALSQVMWQKLKQNNATA